jgi:zinc D-Ala-D-Ala dipeptidase
MKFTYLDAVDSTIRFDPVMARNWYQRDEGGYSLFSKEESQPFTIPGYYGKRCVIDEEMALALCKIQSELLPQGLSLKVYDAYRPQKCVTFFTQWSKMADTPLAKKYHYPHVEKKDFHELSYLSQTSSHTLGTAVDLTIVHLDPAKHRRSCPADFLGYFDPESLDMGVGYLCFDELSWPGYQNFAEEIVQNRMLLRKLMLDQGFVPLDTEFWHYYFKTERNRSHYFDFDIQDHGLDVEGQESARIQQM